MTAYSQSSYSHHSRQPIGVIGFLVIIGIAIFVAGIAALTNRDRDQRQEIARQAREIARITTTCADSQAGERLTATILAHNTKGTWELRCVYTSSSGYGRASRVGRAS